MATIVSLLTPGMQPFQRKVQENVPQVAEAVNKAATDHWIALVDADTGKEFAVRALWVDDIFED